MSKARANLNGQVEHLFYELRMLLGAVNMCALAEENGWGHATNYLKDSVYIHARNLYSFFTDRTNDDVSIEDFGLCFMYSELYSQRRDAINRRVMHINPGRPTRNDILEPIGSTQLNELIGVFAAELETMWAVWVSLTDDTVLKAKLSQALKDARDQANEDSARIYTVSSR